VSVTRRQVVVGTLAVAMGAGAARAQAQAGGTGQLGRLLTFEHRLEAGYRAALDRGAIDAALGRSLVAQEREHVRGVEVALRSVGRRSPPAGEARPTPSEALSGRRNFARFALALEAETAAAYVEVLATLDAPGLLQPLGSIMTAGAQHQVALRRLLGDPLLAQRH
jgi:hypothetical protein